jgi:hypothetical protein
VRADAIEVGKKDAIWSVGIYHFSQSRDLEPDANQIDVCLLCSGVALQVSGLHDVSVSGTSQCVKMNVRDFDGHVVVGEKLSNG